MAAFTGLANVTGAPALNLPAGRSAAGVPIGMQVSVFGKDETELIRFARLWEDLGGEFGTVRPADRGLRADAGKLSDGTCDGHF